MGPIVLRRGLRSARATNSYHCAGLQIMVIYFELRFGRVLVCRYPGRVASAAFAEAGGTTLGASLPVRRKLGDGATARLGAPTTLRPSRVGFVVSL